MASWIVATLFNVGAIIFTAGIVYNKVSSSDKRLERIENIFDQIVVEKLGGKK